MRRPRVLIVTHQDNCGPALWEGVLAALADPVVLRPYAGDPVPETMDGYDGLLVFGGAMAVFADTGKCHWLDPVMALQRHAVDEGVPTLGICLGAQMLAVACGGVAWRAPQGPEIGVFSIDVLPAAADDPLLADMARRPALMWHYDEVCQPPPGAVVLARTGHCAVQAFRVGDVAWGLQFHPEAGAVSAAAWGADETVELLRQGRDPMEIVGEVRALEPLLRGSWLPLVERWLAIASARLVDAGLVGEEERLQAS